MKYLVFIFLFGCGVTAQNVSEDTKEDQEFQKLLKKSQANIQSQAAIQEVASNEQKKIVAQTVTKIVELKEENKDLKVELKEVKVKLDSFNNDIDSPFLILPLIKK